MTKHLPPANNLMVLNNTHDDFTVYMRNNFWLRINLFATN